MQVSVLRVGHEQTPVAVVDDAIGNAAGAVDMAAGLAPFPPIDNNYYPGQRRLIGRDEPANAYTATICNAMAPVMHQVFGVGRFHVREASFSIVTQRPDTTQLIQRVPHFDTVDAEDYAILHFLATPPQGGTAFYRHRRTGYERLTQSRYAPYLAALDQDLAEFGPPAPAYVTADSPIFEQIGRCDGLFNRILIYQGALLHCAEIARDFAFDADPRRGRLTGNIFIRALAP
jgi:hypothetical protein